MAQLMIFGTQLDEVLDVLLVEFRDLAEVNVSCMNTELEVFVEQGKGFDQFQQHSSINTKRINRAMPQIFRTAGTTRTSNMLPKDLSNVFQTFLLWHQKRIDVPFEADGDLGPFGGIFKSSKDHFVGVSVPVLEGVGDAGVRDTGDVGVGVEGAQVG